MQFAFKDLEVWQKAVTFAVNVIDTVETSQRVGSIIAKNLEQEGLEIDAMIKGLINAISGKS